MDDVADVTPLQVMLALMRRRWQDEDCEGALSIAKAAAPYMHPRAVRAAASRGVAEMDDDELGWMDVELN